MEGNWHFRGVQKLENQDWSPKLDSWGLFWGQNDMKNSLEVSATILAEFPYKILQCYYYFQWNQLKRAKINWNPSLLSPLGRLLGGVMYTGSCILTDSCRTLTRTSAHKRIFSTALQVQNWLIFMGVSWITNRGCKPSCSGFHGWYSMQVWLPKSPNLKRSWNVLFPCWWSRCWDSLHTCPKGADSSASSLQFGFA